MEPVFKKSEMIVAEARSWLGTPYHHHADVKGPRGGVDCAMFLVRVFVDTGIVPPFDPRPYAQYFYLHQDEPKYQNWVETYGHQVDVGEPGDVALFQFGRAISHGGVYIGDDLMIHAFADAGCVTASEIQRSPMMLKRFKGFWRVSDGR